ncbi:MAG TPA: hypothetical protein VIH14_07690 [Anaerolineales bacterium]
MKNPSLKHLSNLETRLLDQAWQKLEGEFRGAPMLAPEAGFVQRWEARRQQAQQRQQRVRNNWLVAANGFAILLFLAVVTALAWGLLVQPTLFTTIVGTIIAFAVFSLTMIQVALSVLTEVPFAIWCLTFAIGASLLSLWADLFNQVHIEKGVNQ